MANTEFSSSFQVEYSLDTSFKACVDACNNLAKFTLENKDSDSHTLLLSGKMSLFSFGETIEISIIYGVNGTSNITITSTPKIGIGANAPGLYGDMGKNKKNLVTIKSAILDELKKYPKEVVYSDNNSESIADELMKYKNLLDIGAITQEEYNQLKETLIH